MSNDGTTKGRSLSFTDLVITVIVGVVAVVILFWLAGVLIGLLWFGLKILVVVGLVAGVVYYLLRRK